MVNRKKKILFFVFLYPLHHLGTHVYALETFHFQGIDTHYMVDDDDNSYFYSKQKDVRINPHLQQNILGYSGKKLVDVKFSSSNLKDSNCYIEGIVKKCQETYVVDAYLPFGKGSHLNLLDCTTNCHKTGELTITDAYISYGSKLNWVFYDYDYKKVGRYSSCYASYGKNNPIWNNEQICSAENFFEKKTFDWGQADGKGSSNGCSMHDDFKHLIMDAGKFAPFYLHCSNPCDGDGCFAAWQCRTYIDMTILAPKTSSWKIYSFGLDKPRPIVKFNLQLNNKTIQHETVELAGEFFKDRDYKLEYQIYDYDSNSYSDLMFIGNYENRNLKVHHATSFLGKPADYLEPEIPFKCVRLAYGKFVDKCYWNKNAKSFRMYGSVEEVYSTLNSKYKEINPTSGNFFELTIKSRKVLKEQFQYTDCNIKHTEQGYYLELGQEILQRGILNGMVRTKLTFNKQILSKVNVDYTNDLKKISYDINCTYAAEIWNGVVLDIMLRSRVNDVMVGFEVCLITCHYSDMKPFINRVRLTSTASSNVSSINIILKKSSTIVKVPYKNECSFVEAQIDNTGIDIDTGHDHYGKGEIVLGNFFNNIAGFFISIWNSWKNFIITIIFVIVCIIIFFILVKYLSYKKKDLDYNFRQFKFMKH